MPDTVRRLPLDRPELAVREYAAIVAELRHEVTGAADLEALATEAVELARAAGATLMAVVAPPDAPPALRTGTLLALPRPAPPGRSCPCRRPPGRPTPCTVSAPRSRPWGGPTSGRRSRWRPASGRP